MVEILVSLAVFSTVILALVGLTWQVSRRSTGATDQTLIMARLLSAVDRVSTVPYDSLPLLNGCNNQLTGNVTVNLCVAVTAQSPRVDSIRIVVRSTIPWSRPDTLLVLRGRARLPVPLR